LQSISRRIEAVCVKTLQDGKSAFGPSPPETAQTDWQNSQLFGIARVFVRLDHIASVIVNANHGSDRLMFFAWQMEDFKVEISFAANCEHSAVRRGGYGGCADSCTPRQG
jgi:hypothetical protein